MKSKILALIVALMLSISSLGVFTSCAVEESGDYDPYKANLAVATYNGGVGREWLDDAIQRFEQKYENATHFEEGKKGVNISLDADKIPYSGTNLADSTLSKDVYLTEGIEYYTMVNKGKVADITDVVTQRTLDAYGEAGVKIESKLDSSFTSYLTAQDGKYYMLPFYDGLYGFIYDVELFEEKGFYFKENGSYTRPLTDDATEADREALNAEKSAGPNGKKGDYDDGLPKTYAQFMQLIQRIKQKSCIPFCYAGGDQDYFDKACRAFIADYEGYDNLKMNYTFSGTATTLVKEVKADGTVVFDDPTPINAKNAYELKRQAGNYYALDMHEKLFKVDNVGGQWNGTSYTQAQKDFIRSKYTDYPYAMLTEGVWWENEAAIGTGFSDMEILYGEKREDRRFGFLPMPKVDDTKVGKGQTLLSANSSFVFINKDCKNMELAKEFLLFLHTEAEMSKFTAKTGITRSLNYNVDANDAKNASNFAKSIIALRADSKVVYPYSSLSVVINNQSAFTEGMWYFTSLVNGRTLNWPSNAFKDGICDAKGFFFGLRDYQENAWKNLNW